MRSSNPRIVILLAIMCAILCLAVAKTYAERDTGVCLRNCVQCRNMYEQFFNMEKCADFCVKYKGKFIPDCEDENSIRIFIQAPENDY